MFKDRPDWLDTSPTAMCEFLEIGLDRMCRELELPKPGIFLQVIDVFGKQVDPYLAGEHFGRDRNRPHAVGNFASSWGTFENGTKPRVYGVAAHEAIGHRIIGRMLMPIAYANDAKQVKFVDEGIAMYTQAVLTGCDPNVYLKQYLETRKGKTEDLDNLFKIGANEDLVYELGGSFVDFVIKGYGLDVFKGLAREARPDNLAAIVAKHTGKKVEEVEAEWRERVLGVIGGN